MLTSYGLLVYFGLKEYKKYYDEQATATATATATGALGDRNDDRDNGSSRSGINNPLTGNPMLVSRSWYYGRSLAKGAGGGGVGGEESESLLPDSAGREELKSKEDGKLYQTATEYRVDRADSYPLPCAPATSYTHEEE